MNGNQDNTQVIEGEVIPATPTPGNSRLRLSSIKDVRREMSTVYREARQGRIPAQEATRLVYMLVSIGNMIKDTELEERISALEKQHDKQN